MKNVTLNIFQNSRNIKSLKFETFQEVSAFIRNDLKKMGKFNLSCSSKKSMWSITTYYKLLDNNIVYEVRNKRSFLKKNVLAIGAV